MSADYYNISELLPGIYRITSPETVYMDLFVGSERALLFDTGFGYGDLLSAVRRITGKPLTVVNSHGHYDHAFGDYRFDKVYIHRADMELCRVSNQPQTRTEMCARARDFFDPVTGKTASILPAGFSAEAYAAAPLPELLPVAEGDAFELGGLRLEVFEFPGHTAGSIGLLDRRDCLLYTGDAMNNNTYLFLPESQPLSVYTASIKKALTLPFERFTSGHFAGAQPRAELERFLNCAVELDFENGRAFEFAANFGVSDVRLCTAKGVSVPDSFGPFASGFASLMISKEKL